MYQDKVVLCGASSYEKLFYLNPDFENLPKEVKDRLKIICVFFTEKVGGRLMLEFDEEGTLLFSVSANDGDPAFDEIGSALEIKKIRNEEQELWESLELYFKVFFLGEDPEGEA
ncbi:MAG: hypothetical protein J5738_01050 [Lachnospiraceae bacterium]|nr:hypothetical protein [Lachnospiraceae bacterium]MBO4669595.1 hypothetical protein [Lachnospiraceae bacterium]MBR5667177.1 hypothetical protein [Lachnospiraceae bacterium]